MQPDRGGTVLSACHAEMIYSRYIHEPSTSNPITRTFLSRHQAPSSVSTSSVESHSTSTVAISASSSATTAASVQQTQRLRVIRLLRLLALHHRLQEASATRSSKRQTKSTTSPSTCPRLTSTPSTTSFLRAPFEGYVFTNYTLDNRQQSNSLLIVSYCNCLSLTPLN